MRPSPKTKAKRARGVAQVVKHLSVKFEVLSSNLNAINKRYQKKKE
jgi:hypothetical protein